MSGYRAWYLEVSYHTTWYKFAWYLVQVTVLCVPRYKSSRSPHFLFLSAAQAEVLTPRDGAAFIDVTLAFLQHCDWQQLAVAPKHGEAK